MKVYTVTTAPVTRGQLNVDNFVAKARLPLIYVPKCVDPCACARGSILN